MQQNMPSVGATLVARPNHTLLRAIASAGIALAAVGATEGALAQSAVTSVELLVAGAEAQSELTAGFGDQIRRSASAALSTVSGTCGLDGACTAGRGVVRASARARGETSTVGASEANATVLASMEDRFTITFAEPLAQPIVLRFVATAEGEPSFSFASPTADAQGANSLSFSCLVRTTTGSLDSAVGERTKGLGGSFVEGEFSPEEFETESGAWGAQAYEVVAVAGQQEVSIDLSLGVFATSRVRTNSFQNFSEAGLGATVTIRWDGLDAIEHADGTPFAGDYAVASDSGFNFVRPEDANFDGLVDAADLAAVLLSWGSGQVATDIDQNGLVDASDMTRVLLAWGR
jgi:hypothetical protein